MKRLLLFLGFLLALNIITHTGHLSAQKPNVVVIITDDQSFNSLAYAGGDVFTPCIDSLAAEGIKFTNAHVPSTVCSPSRYSFLSGKYSGRSYGEKFLNRCPEGTLARIENIVELSEGEANLGSILQQNGYKTGFVGKSHVMELDILQKSNWESYGLQTYDQTDDPYDPEVSAKMSQNHDVMQELVRSYGFDYADGIYMANVKELNNDALNVHNLEWTVDKALTFIEEEQENPFFLFFSTTLHHGPVPWGKKDGKYWSSFHADPKITGEGIIDTVWEFMPNRLDILDKAVKAGYPENTAYTLLLDEGVRAIYKKIADLGIENNTLIIFMSDHGSWRHGKATLHDYGTKVPMFMYWKDFIPSGVDYRGLIQSTDVAPTLLDLAGIDFENKYSFDGKSLKHILETGQGEAHDSLYAELGYARSVKTRKWKYIAVRYPDDVQAKIDRGGTWTGFDGSIMELPYLTQNGHLGYHAARKNPHYFERDQLYDLEADSAETVNLFDQYPEVVLQLKNLLAGFLRDFPNRPFGEFTRDPETPPSRATFPMPRTTSTMVSFENTALTWESEAGADSHDLYFGSSNPPPFIGNQVETSYTPGELLPNTRYYWRVDELNNYGKTDGITWSFTTSSATKLTQNRFVENEIILYPNPATGNTYISAKWFENTPVSIQVYNSEGQILINQLHDGGPKIQLDVSHFEKGIYFISCRSDEFRKTVKLTVC